MSDTFDHEGDAWASLDDDRDDDRAEYAYFARRRRPYFNAGVRCNRCGASCTWGMLQGKWRLVQHGSFHQCGSAQLDEFEDLTKN